MKSVIERGDIASTYDLAYESCPKRIAAVIAKAGHNPEDDDVWSAVVEDDDSGIWASMDGEQAASRSWEMQRVRGLVAAELGFAAVEMSDEHGTSYLVLPGATMTIVGEQVLTGAQAL